jgi:outer membrane immunogenic protein
LPVPDTRERWPALIQPRQLVLQGRDDRGTAARRSRGPKFFPPDDFMGIATFKDSLSCKYQQASHTRRLYLTVGPVAMKFCGVLIFAAAATMQSGLLNGQAFAADLPDAPRTSLKDTPPDFSPIWPGFYFGAHAGGAWGDTGTHDTFTYVGDPTFNGSLGSMGFIGGAQAGYNIQRGRFVFGIEGDIGYLGLNASKGASFHEGTCARKYGDGTSQTYSGQYCDVDAKYSTSGGLYGDLTGRFGYAMDRTLFYAKGGFAFLNADFKANYAGGNCTFDYGCGGHRNVPSTFNFGQSDTLAGWTAGAGAEYVLSPSWSLKAEYQHFDFGSMSYTYSGTYLIPGFSHDYGHYTSTINGKANVSATADAVTVGVNYHLNN